MTDAISFNLTYATPVQVCSTGHLRQNIFQTTMSKTRRYPKLHSDQISLFLSRLKNHAKENANNPYQRGNKIPLQKQRQTK